MSERENFFGRWSRLKREADEARDTPAPQTSGDHQPSEKDAVAHELEDALKGPANDTAESEPAFDLSKLPPIESITAATDIRPFLAAGVPDNVKYAALRRAWVADPHIRDFVGIAENQWDFTAPDGLHGFGPLLPSDDVAKLVSNVFGDAPQPERESSTTLPVTDPEPAQNPQDGVVDATGPVDPADLELALVEQTSAGTDALESSTSEDLVITQCNKIDIALQDSTELSEPRGKMGKRNHGSALPE